MSDTDPLTRHAKDFGVAVQEALKIGFDRGQEAMRQRAADLLDLKPSKLRLMAGEMTAQEIRTAQAFLKNRAAAIAALPLEEMP